jgi:hypothetical protein
LSLAQRNQVEAIIDQQSAGTMAFTGNGLGAPLVAGALALLLAGAGIMMTTRRRRRREDRYHEGSA